MTPEEIEAALVEIHQQIIEEFAAGAGPLIVVIAGTNKAYFNTL